jgi:PAS domain S-box-containing protein
MHTIGVASLAKYRNHLETHPEEYDHLLDAILINVTSFFRDSPAWDYLAAEIVPRIVDGSTDRSIRLCSAGCASGEEAYTLAMLFAEALGADEFRRRVKIYATDVDEGALNAARLAGYSNSQVTGVPAHLLTKYFESRGDRHVFRSDIRRAVVFGRQDVTQDAPIPYLDLLACRNTLMYFNGEIQTSILSRFHFALKDTGFLFLGRAEMLVRHIMAFTPVSIEWRVYAKATRPQLLERARLMAEHGAIDGGTNAMSQHRPREMPFDAGESAEHETTNEELQSTIKALDTANEELETMNEELQATNEEQRTLNEQLHQRSRELDRLSVHLNAILTGIRTAIVTTDAELRVEIWNPGAEVLWGRRAAEVLGKRLCDIDVGLPMEWLETSIRMCLDDKAGYQEAGLSATNRLGRAITCHVTLTPLLDLSGGVQGVILLMEERLPV